MINFVTAKFESTTSMQDFVKPFNDSSSSYQVVVRELPPPSQSTEVHQQLVQQLGAGSGDIDVFTQDVIWPAEFASAGWAMDLSSEFPQAERDKFFPGLVQSVTWQDKLVGLPFYLDAGQLYYRKDVLKDKGMKVPTTWQATRHLRQGTAGLRRHQERLPLAGQAGRGVGLQCGLLRRGRRGGHSRLPTGRPS